MRSSGIRLFRAIRGKRSVVPAEQVNIERRKFEWLFLADIVPPPVREFIRSPLAFATLMAGLGFIAGAIALWLAWNAHVFVNSLSIDATLNVGIPGGGSIPLTATVKHVYGYFGEVNHGMFYLLLAPAFIFLSLNFCRSVGGLMADMTMSGLLILKTERATGSLIQRYLAHKVHKGDWRRVTRWGFIILPALTIGFNFYSEYSSRAKLDGIGGTKFNAFKPAAQRDIRWMAIGYVQTDYLNEWVATFNRKRIPGDSKPWIPAKSRADELDGYIFGEGIRSSLGNQLDGLAKVSNIDLSEFFKESELKYNESQKLLITPAGLKKLEEQNLLSLRARSAGAFEHYAFGENIFHHLFLWYNLTLEGAFHGYAFWMALKLLSFFSLLRDLIPNQGDKHLEVRPFLYDPQRHFGLDALFRCYNRIAVLLALGASFLVLMSMNEIQSQSIAHPFHVFSPLNILGFALVVLALATLVLGPFVFASAALKKQQDLELEKLNGQLKKLRTSGGDYKELYDKIRVVESQTTWPRTDTGFLTALAICLVALAFPFPVVSQLVGKQGEEWITLARAVQKTFHTIISPG
jgi:hypothetical protein